MPVLRVRGGEEQGDLEGDEGEEEEEKGLRNYAALYITVHLYSATSCQLVRSFATNKSVLLLPRLLNHVVGS